MKEANFHMQCSSGHLYLGLFGILPETFVGIFAVFHEFQSILRLLNLMRYFLDSVLSLAIGVL